MENLKLAGHIKKGQREAVGYLVDDLMWMNGSGEWERCLKSQTLLKAAWDRMLWRAIIAHVLEVAHHIEKDTYMSVSISVYK